MHFYRQRRNESDLENLQLSQHRLKELLVQRDREVQQALESERQMKNKLKKISDLLKAEKDEVLQFLPAGNSKTIFCSLVLFLITKPTLYVASSLIN